MVGVPKPEPVTVTGLLGGLFVGLTAMMGFTTKVIPGIEPVGVIEP